MNKINITGYKKTNHNTKKMAFNNHLLFYKIILAISIMVMIISISYSIYGYNNRNSQEKISKSLSDIYSMSQLYSNNNQYNLSPVYNKDKEDENFLVLGIIRIDKIKISYPILSTINDELLKISPCRFYGPEPNEIGNLCIAAHNYDDNRFFSKINKLKTGDIITIYDNIGNYKDYYVYQIFETKNDDVSCTSQKTDNKREITLVTCNNLNGNRIIIKAKE